MNTICPLCGDAIQPQHQKPYADCCYKCLRKFSGEWRCLGIQRGRARKHNLPDTLTLAEWLQTLIDFDYKCAYCQEKEYEVFEHFIPLRHYERGTTVDNCVPSCRSCDKIKHDTHPLRYPVRLGVEITARVAAYLDNRRNTK